MLGYADAIAISNFSDRDAVLDGGLKIDVIRSDTRCDRELQLLCLGDPFRRQISRPKGLGDDNVRIGKLAFEDGGRALFIRGYDEGVA